MQVTGVYDFGVAKANPLEMPSEEVELRQKYILDSFSRVAEVRSKTNEVRLMERALIG